MEDHLKGLVAIRSECEGVSEENFTRNVVCEVGQRDGAHCDSSQPRVHVQIQAQEFDRRAAVYEPKSGRALLRTHVTCYEIVIFGDRAKFPVEIPNILYVFAVTTISVF